MDYADALRSEAMGAHAQFHEYVLLVGSASTDHIFLFYEGEDDPIFYNNFLLARIGVREYREFICMGRDAVLHVHQMVARDGRANGRALFFIDKDNNDVLNPRFSLPDSVYQTNTYSFENHLICLEVLRRFWVERLKLSAADDRFDLWRSKMLRTHEKYMRRCRVLMALILIGRGIDGSGPVKLNLNNVNLRSVFELRLDPTSERVRWRKGAGAAFMSAINLGKSSINVSRIKKVCRAFLCGEPKIYVRGKFEAWFFVRFLQEMTRALSDKAESAAAGTKRAKPVEMVSDSNFISMVSSLTPCPDTLEFFLDETLPRRLAT